MSTKHANFIIADDGGAADDVARAHARGAPTGSAPTHGHRSSTPETRLVGFDGRSPDHEAEGRRVDRRPRPTPGRRSTRASERPTRSPCGRDEGRGAGCGGSPRLAIFAGRVCSSAVGWSTRSPAARRRPHRRCSGADRTRRRRRPDARRASQRDDPLTDVDLDDAPSTGVAALPWVAERADDAALARRPSRSRITERGRWRRARGSDGTWLRWSTPTAACSSSRRPPAGDVCSSNVPGPARAGAVARPRRRPTRSSVRVHAARLSCGAGGVDVARRGPTDVELRLRRRRPGVVRLGPADDLADEAARGRPTRCCARVDPPTCVAVLDVRVPRQRQSLTSVRRNVG